MISESSGSGSSILARLAFVVPLVLGCVGSHIQAQGPQFELTGTQPAPGGGGGESGGWDCLLDGRILSIIGDEILLESAPRSGNYEFVGEFPPGMIAPWGASFLEIDPSGTQFMIGDNNFDGALVYLIKISDLTGGILTPTGFLHENFAATWRNNQQIAISYGNPVTFLGEVAILDIATGVTTPILTIGGASGGVAFDETGNLLAANGFDFVGGGSETGDIRAFDYADVVAVLEGKSDVLNFDTTGVFVLNALSGSPLRFDVDANLMVGGGRLDEGNFFALADAGAVADAVAGYGPVVREEMFTADPVPDADSNYRGQFNPQTGEWIIDGANGKLYRYSYTACLDLTVDQMYAGEFSKFTITRGTPGQRAGLVHGWKRGTTVVRRDQQICADFGIRGVKRKRLLSAEDLRFDDDGVAEVVVWIPSGTQGRRLLFEAAQAGTCPEDCTSNVLAISVE